MTVHCLLHTVNCGRKRQENRGKNPLYTRWSEYKEDEQEDHKNKNTDLFITGV